MKKSDKRVNGNGSTKYPSQLKSYLRGKDKKPLMFWWQCLLTDATNKKNLCIIIKIYSPFYRAYIPTYTEFICKKMDLHDWGKW